MIRDHPFKVFIECLRLRVPNRRTFGSDQGLVTWVETWYLMDLPPPRKARSTSSRWNSSLLRRY